MAKSATIMCMIRPKNIVYGLIVLLVLVLCLPASTKADTNEAIGQNSPQPNSGTLSGGAGFQPWNGVGRGDFDGNYSMQKIYVRDGGATITINQTCDDVGNPGPDVRYSVYAMTQQENLLSTRPFSEDKPGPPVFGEVRAGGDCKEDRKLNIKWNEGIKSTVPGHEGFRVFAFVASIIPTGTSAERYFRINNSNGLVGLAKPNAFNDRRIIDSPNDKYTSLYDTTNGRFWSYSVMFAPKCTFDDSQQTLRIFDADNGIFQDNMTADLISSPKAGNLNWSGVTPWNRNQVQGGAIGASNTTSDPLNFAAGKNKIYKFSVNNARNPNTIQIKLPFDQIDADRSFNNYQGCDFWELDGQSRVKDDVGNFVSNDQSREEGKQGTFRHWVENKEANRADYTWTVLGSYQNNAAYSPTYSNGNKGGNQISKGNGGGNLDSRTVSSVGKDVKNPVYNYQYKFPANAKAGDKYCQKIQYTNANGRNTATRNSDPVCYEFKTDNTISCTSIKVVNKGGYNGKLTRTSVVTTNFNSGASVVNDFVTAGGGGSTSGQQSRTWNVVATGLNPSVTIKQQYWDGNSWETVPRSNNPLTVVKADCFAKPACLPHKVNFGNDKYLQKNDPFFLTIELEGSFPASKTTHPIWLWTSAGLDIVQANREAGTNKFTYVVPANTMREERDYRVLWILPDTGLECEGVVRVWALPTFKVNNGSLRTGGNFASTEGGDGRSDALDNGWLAGYYRHPTSFFTSDNFGSSVDLSVLSNRQNVGVASAQKGSANSPNPTGLTFANSDATKIGSENISPKLGGAFRQGGFLGIGGGGGSFYDPEQPKNAVELTNAFNALNNGQASNSGSYYRNGNTLLFASDIANEANGKGKNISIYINDGDVLISSLFFEQLKYAGNNWPVDGVPSFTLVVTGGDIYIDSDITQLEGVYVSKRTGGTNGQGGTIYTCSEKQGYKPFEAGSGAYRQNCAKPLTVNGAFVADQINLMRTGNTLKESSTSASETFNYNKMLPFSRPAVSPSSGGALQYDSITSLPPVL